MKTVSIIIPTFNRAHMVARAIESAINQTYPCEIILCDHGSSDGTPDVAARYKAKLRYVRRDEDRGPIVCWRDGLEHATGEIIHFHYDDDWMEPEYVRKTVELLKDDVGFVYSRYFLHFENNKVTIGNVHPSSINPMEDITKYLLLAPLTISPGCAIFRRVDALKNLLLEVPGAVGRYGKNSGVGEDLLLFLLTSRDYPKYAHLDEPLVHFAAHSNSITTDSILSGHKSELQDSYDNAKRHYYTLSKSLSLSSSKINHTLFKIRWKARAGTLVKDLFVATVQRVIRK